jgi:hypothetical protein
MAQKRFFADDDVLKQARKYTQDVTILAQSLPSD